MIELTDYNTCLICLQNITKNEKILPCCNTYYHGKCIKKWIRRKNSCPHCRNIINNQNNQQHEHDEHHEHHEDDEHVQHDEHEQPDDVSINIIQHPIDNTNNDLSHVNYIIVGYKVCLTILFIFVEIIVISCAVILFVLYIIE